MTASILPVLRDFVHVAHAFIAVLLRRIKDDQVLIMAAALAYYGFLAVIPLLLLGLSVADYALGSSQAFYDHAAVALRGVLPSQSLDELGKLAREFGRRRELFAGVGIVSLVWIGMRIFDVLAQELSRIWRAPRPRGWIARKGVSFAAFALAAVLFLLSVAATSLAAAKGYDAAVLGIDLSELALPWHVLTAVTPMVISVLMFLCLYTLLPNTTVSRRSALLGAVLAAAVWELSKAVFQHFVLYFPTYDRLYGSLAGVTILVLWFNLTAISLLIGAEVAAVCQLREAEPTPSPDSSD